MALTEIKTSGIADDAVTTDKLANAINTERTANTAKPSLANDANNRVVTGDGSGGLNGEANLTFDGDTLQLTETGGDSADGARLDLKFGNNNSTDVISSITFSNGAGEAARIQGETSDANNSGVITFHTDNAGTSAERLRIDSGGNVTVTDGDLLIGTSGHGIDFGATSDASGATSEKLGDYEEGTWTPNPNDGSCTSAVAVYRKIGKVVHISARCSGFSDTSTNDMVRIKGLPYAPLSGWYGAAGACMAMAVTEGVGWISYAETDQIRFYATGTGSFPQLRHNELGSGHEIYFEATYPTG